MPALRLRRLAALATALPALLGAAAALAERSHLPIGPDLAALGWRALPAEDRRIERFVGHSDGVLEVGRDGEATWLGRRVAAAHADPPRLSWRWRVEDGPPEPFALGARDDQAVAVYVGFAWNVETASAWERFVRPFVVARYGESAPGRVIIYAWGGTAPRGTIVESPVFRDAGRVIVLRPADAPRDTWLDETVDLASDYRKAFGEAAPPVVEVGVAAGAEGAPLRAFLCDFRLEPGGR